MTACGAYGCRELATVELHDVAGAIPLCDPHARHWVSYAEQLGQDVLVVAL